MSFALGYAVIMPTTLEGMSTAPMRKTKNSEEYNCVTAVMPFMRKYEAAVILRGHQMCSRLALYQTLSSE